MFKYLMDKITIPQRDTADSLFWFKVDNGIHLYVNELLRCDDTLSLVICMCNNICTTVGHGQL